MNLNALFIAWIRASEKQVTMNERTMHEWMKGWIDAISYVNKRNHKAQLDDCAISEVRDIPLKIHFLINFDIFKLSIEAQKNENHWKSL